MKSKAITMWTLDLLLAKDIIRIIGRKRWDIWLRNLIVIQHKIVKKTLSLLFVSGVKSLSEAFNLHSITERHEFYCLYAPFAKTFNILRICCRLCFALRQESKGRIQAAKRLSSDTKTLIINSIKTNKKVVRLKLFSALPDAAFSSSTSLELFLVARIFCRTKKLRKIIELSWVNDKNTQDCDKARCLFSFLCWKGHSRSFVTKLKQKLLFEAFLFTKKDSRGGFNCHHWSPCFSTFKLDV